MLFGSILFFFWTKQSFVLPREKNKGIKDSSFSNLLQCWSTTKIGVWKAFWHIWSTVRSMLRWQSRRAVQKQPPLQSVREPRISDWEQIDVRLLCWALMLSYYWWGFNWHTYFPPETVVHHALGNKPWGTCLRNLFRSMFTNTLLGKADWSQRHIAMPPLLRPRDGPPTF